MDKDFQKEIIHHLSRISHKLSLIGSMIARDTDVTVEEWHKSFNKAMDCADKEAESGPIFNETMRSKDE